MNRRSFLILSIISTVGAMVSKVLANAKVYVQEGKLGYKKVASAGRECHKCKHYEAKEQNGICKLPVMKNVMKTSEAYVLPNATCNMWISR
jgi:hypothetical protein